MPSTTLPKEGRGESEADESMTVELQCPNLPGRSMLPSEEGRQREPPRILASTFADVLSNDASAIGVPGAANAKEVPSTTLPVVAAANRGRGESGAASANEVPSTTLPVVAAANNERGESGAASANEVQVQTLPIVAAANNGRDESEAVSIQVPFSP